ncbi:response regulator [Shewanella cyperi]|uniref:Response regulator n=1 Tax=Shewanella cyperi TaxID=2814292 RepID=A0A974XIB1_9GAMM|nr:response regulator [Shewanella cyperi]QSX28925.1 response regulator [Shewanella cyperi]QSX39655.1 response regulator [Shewanella cyperi]
MALNDVSVLLVEDDPVFRKIVASFLDSRGALVIEADDGEKGLARFRQQSFDIVLADLSMPNLGGLDMLREMYRLDPSLPSIVISGNNVMADVVEALRIGASDFLVKPVSDLYTIEQSIKQSLVGKTEQVKEFAELDELSRMELDEHLRLLEQSTEAARHLQHQLFPASSVVYPQAQIDYSLYRRDNISAYFIDSTMADSEHLLLYMAHFHPENNSAAFAGVMLRSFVNQKLKAMRNGLGTMVLEPFNMLCYLNERVVKSGLDITVDIIYIVVELKHYRAAIAQAGHGLRCYLRNEKGLSPLALPDALQLGVLDWGKPSTQFRTLLPGEKLCISTSEPEHKSMLLQDRFDGLAFEPDLASGGYVQVSF